MSEDDYPALYSAASALSSSSQAAFFHSFLLHSSCLLVAAVSAMTTAPSVMAAVLQATALGLALASAVYIFNQRPERSWYAGRALAESIKTSTWRFVCRAEPYHLDDVDSHRELVWRLRMLLGSHADVVKRMSVDSRAQVTERMASLRSQSLDARRAFYRSHRINEQLKWYADKAAYNRRHGAFFAWLLWITISAAIVLAVVRVSYPAAPYWPTDAVIVFASSVLGWVQAKRFQELAASYTLTAHEISMIRERSLVTMDEQEFSSFVGDAENAFSREHTQWLARRDE